MYLRHYGLRSKPFALDHNLSFFYPAAHRNATDDLCYSIEERQGIATLIGEPGTGKTTLLKHLLGSFTKEMRGVLVSDAAVAGDSLFTILIAELDLEDPETQPLSTFLRKQLQRLQTAGHLVVVLVDEAQDLTDTQLHEVRALSNLEHDSTKLVQMILAGQPSLESRLSEPQFAALHQRVAVRTAIQPLTRGHTERYIQMRLWAAGAPDQHLILPAAIGRIHELSRGIPRLINLICDRALVWGYAEDSREVGEIAVEESSRELGIAEKPAPLPPPTSSVETRLEAIELKLDQVLRALSSKDSPQDNSPTAGRQPDRHVRRVSDFPPRKPGTG